MVNLTLPRVGFLLVADRRRLVSMPPDARAYQDLCGELAGFGGGLFEEAAPLSETAFREAVRTAREILGEDPTEEDLGALYEGLIDPRRRRTAGAHYTPRVLTEPIVRRALADGATRVCDPACGSGAFLLAAYRDLCRRMESAEALRRLYAVDRDPVAVEMARLCLWLAAGRPDWPLSFMNHAVKCGDALVGLCRIEEEPSLFRHEEACRRAVHRVAAGGGDEDELVTWKALADRQLGARFPRAFHWPLEFPEVFTNGGFDAMIGNPPFLGGLKTVERHGEPYAAYLAQLHPGLNKKTDLAAHFLRRAHTLTRLDGRIGMIGTTTLTQGRTRRGSLEYLQDDGRRIVAASSRATWPGAASLEICVVHFGPRSSPPPFYLDGRAVDGINSMLREGDEARPYPLAENRGLCFQGVNFGGAPGFLVPGETARAWLDEDSKNNDVVRPYVTGDDLGQRPPGRADKWCVSFGERSEDGARQYARPYEHLRRHVHPVRQNEAAARYPRMQKEWWKFWHGRLGLYQKDRGQSRWFMRTRVTKTHAIAESPTHWIHSDGIVVFKLDGDLDFAVLQSSFHELWAFFYASSLGAAPRYIATDCFVTFPRPQLSQCQALPSVALTSDLDPAYSRDVRNSVPQQVQDELARAGRSYLELRCDILHTENIGLTRCERLFHDPSAESLGPLRHGLRMIDRWCALAYGWTDLELEHDFCETRLGVRFTLPRATRREILRRLLLLNHARHAEGGRVPVPIRRGDTPLFRA